MPVNQQTCIKDLVLLNKGQEHKEQIRHILMKGQGGRYNVYQIGSERYIH